MLNGILSYLNDIISYIIICNCILMGISHRQFFMVSYIHLNGILQTMYREDIDLATALPQLRGVRPSISPVSEL